VACSALKKKCVVEGYVTFQFNGNVVLSEGSFLKIEFRSGYMMQFVSYCRTDPYGSVRVADIIAVGPCFRLESSTVLFNMAHKAVGHGWHQDVTMTGDRYKLGAGLTHILKSIA
jgi:hypothetical protein